MRFVPRLLGEELRRAARHFPALISVKGYQASAFVVHRPQGDAARLSALRPGVRAGSLEQILDVVTSAFRGL